MSSSVPFKRQIAEEFLAGETRSTVSRSATTSRATYPCLGQENLRLARSMKMLTRPILSRNMRRPAPGSEETELGVFMGLEVSHGEAKVQLPAPDLTHRRAFLTCRRMNG
jgi:hypothetical protein